ncbi:Protein NRDE2 [Nymphon striatum]|nr:Protein NRDE2 [Nymphon striatum]
MAQGKCLFNEHWLHNPEFSGWLVWCGLKSSGKCKICMNNNDKPDWLSNKSFVPEAAELVHKNHNTENRREREKERKKAHVVCSQVRPARELFIGSQSLKNYGKKIFIEDAQKPPEQAFYVDRNGDGSNKGFSSMYHLYVAKFHSVKLSLGFKKEDRIELLKIKKKKHLKRYFSKNHFKLLYNENEIDTVVANKGPSEVTYDYISLNSCAAQNNFNLSINVRDSFNENPLGIYDASTALYVQGKGKSLEPSNKNPSNTALWLEFVHFQNHIMEVEACSESSKDKRQIKVNMNILTEKKLSILEKAISLNPKSVELAIQQLRLYEDIWPSNKIADKWKDLGFYHPHSVLYWRDYLTFAQSDLNSFSANAAGKAFMKCLTTLRNFADGTFQSHQAPDDLDTFIIEIFIMSVHFYKNTGYTERAVSIIQAMLEFTFFQPDSIKSSSFKEKLDHFELFWDSGASRIGENTATGWKNMKNNVSVDSSDVLDLDVLEDAIISKNSSMHNTWLELESLRERENWVPWRPDKDKGMTNEDCEDIDRLVLFDDVYLTIFSPTSEKTKFILVLQCLMFLGIDIFPHMSSLCQKLGCHTQTRLCSSNSFSPFKLFNFAYGKTSHSKNTPEISDFDDSIWKNVRQEDFISNVFENLIPCFEEPHLTELKLLWCNWKIRQIYHSNGCLKQRSQRKLIRRELKNFLQAQENRTKVELWVVYALFEVNCGNISEAEKVLKLILTSNNSGLSFDIVYAYHVYCEMLLHNTDISVTANKQKIQSILICCGCGEKFVCNEDRNFSPNIVLKTKKSYSNHLENLLTTPVVTSMIRDSPLADWLACYALFLYTMNGLGSAMEIYECSINELKKKSADNFILEQIYTNYLRLMLHDTNNTVSSLSGIRKVLQTAIEIFPDNQHFLQLFIDIEARSFISGRQRRFFTHTLEADKDVHPITWCQAVHAELLRLESLQTNSSKCDTHFNKDKLAKYLVPPSNGNMVMACDEVFVDFAVFILMLFTPNLKHVHCVANVIAMEIVYMIVAVLGG